MYKWFGFVFFLLFSTMSYGSGPFSKSGLDKATQKKMLAAYAELGKELEACQKGPSEALKNYKRVFDEMGKSTNHLNILKSSFEVRGKAKKGCDTYSVEQYSLKEDPKKTGYWTQHCVFSPEQISMIKEVGRAESFNKDIMKKSIHSFLGCDIKGTVPLPNIKYCAGSGCGK